MGPCKQEKLVHVREERFWGEKDLRELIEEGESIEMSCHFCNEKYNFSVAEMQEMLEKIHQQKK